MFVDSACLLAVTNVLFFFFLLSFLLVYSSAGEKWI